MLPFFTWCENTSIGEAIRGSLWLFPVIESFHLLALAVLGGTVLAVSLRLLGVPLGEVDVARLWTDLRPWMTASLGVMLASGVLLFFSEAVKLYYSEAFWVKMLALVLASLFSMTLVRHAALGERRRWRDRVVGLTGLALWFAVGAAGRWIGFS